MVESQHPTITITATQSLSQRKHLPHRHSLRHDGNIRWPWLRSDPSQRHMGLAKAPRRAFGLDESPIPQQQTPRLTLPTPFNVRGHITPDNRRPQQYRRRIPAPGHLRHRHLRLVQAEQYRKIQTFLLYDRS